MPKKKSPISCRWKAEKKTCTGKNENKSRLYKHKGDLEWEGIKTEKYKPKGGDWADIIRRVIVGNRGLKGQVNSIGRGPLNSIGQIWPEKGKK